MPERVETPDSISINAIRYPVRGGVSRFLASQPTPRMVVGAPAARVGQNRSSVSWTDWRGGIGVQRMDPAVDGNRAWWSTCNLRQNRHLTLPRLATTTAAAGVAGSWTVGAINERANVIYAAFGTAVRSYNSVTDSWGSTLTTLSQNATDSLNVRMAGTEYLVIAHSNGYVYFDGTTWTADTRSTQFLIYWDDRLWGISSTGLLWSAGTIGTEEDDAQLPLPNSSVTALFLGRAPDGDIIIYAATLEGLFSHDADAQEFKRVELSFPRHPDGGKGATAWRDSTYLSAGLGVYKYINGEVSGVVTTVGLDADHGLPAAYRGGIVGLIPTHNELVALLDATTGPGAVTRHMSGVMGNSEVVQPDSGRSGIFGWDGVGWQVLWTSDAATLPITAGHVSNAYDDYRLWWAQDQRVRWLRLPRDVVNPDEVTDYTYAASATHETPWFDADETHGDKLGIVLCLDVTGMSANETITARYRLNYDDTVANQTSFAVITTNGHTEYLFPNATTPSGTVYRQIKFVLDLARGSTNTLTPDINRLDFYFDRKEDTRWGATVLVEVPPEGAFGRSAEQLFDNLVTAVESVSRVEVTWRNREANDGGTANPYNYYMKIVQFTGVEETGQDFSGTYRLTMVVP